MGDSENTEPMIPPRKSDSSIKEYFCPYCNKSLFKGKVKKLNMACHHCQKLINADENELIRPARVNPDKNLTNSLVTQDKHYSPAIFFVLINKIFFNSFWSSQKSIFPSTFFV